MNFIQAGVWMGLRAPLKTQIVLLGSSDEACYKQQYDSAYSGRDQGTYQSRHRDAHKVKEVGAKYSTDNAYDNIANDAEASSFHYNSGQPARDGTDGQDNDQAL
jgi:hypothetical protein